MSSSWPGGGPEPLEPPRPGPDPAPPASWGPAVEQPRQGPLAGSGSPTWRGPAWVAASETLRGAAAQGRIGAQAGASHAVSAGTGFVRALAASWTVIRRSPSTFVLPVLVYGLLLLLVAGLGALAPVLGAVRWALWGITSYERLRETGTVIGSIGSLLVTMGLLALSAPVLALPAALLGGGQINAATRGVLSPAPVPLREGFLSSGRILLATFAVLVLTQLLALLGVLPGLVAAFLLLYAIPGIARGIGVRDAVRVSVRLAWRNPALTALVLGALVLATAIASLLLLIPLLVVLPMGCLLVTCVFTQLGGPEAGAELMRRRALAAAARAGS